MKISLSYIDGNTDILWRKGSSNYLWYMKADGTHTYKKISDMSVDYVVVDGVSKTTVPPVDTTPSLTREELIQLIKNWAKEPTQENADKIINANTSQITDMSDMFHFEVMGMRDVPLYTDLGDEAYNTLKSFDFDISNWNTSSVTNMNSMFSFTVYSHSLNSWDVTNVIDYTHFSLFTSMPKENLPNFLDNKAPVITLNGVNPQTVLVGHSYNELGATAKDANESHIAYGEYGVDNSNGLEDFTDNIVIDESAVDTSVEGNYTVTYNVADTAGNEAVEVNRTVSVLNNTCESGTEFTIGTWNASGSYDNFGDTLYVSGTTGKYYQDIAVPENFFGGIVTLTFRGEYGDNGMTLHNDYFIKVGSDIKYYGYGDTRSREYINGEMVEISIVTRDYYISPEAIKNGFIRIVVSANDTFNNNGFYVIDGGMTIKCK